MGLEQTSGERDGSVDAATNASKAGVAGTLGRTFKLKEAKAVSLDGEDGGTRGTNWSDMTRGLAIIIWLTGHSTAL